MKTKKTQVFYTVNASQIEGGACLNRGIFDALRDAQSMADGFAEWEIWRHEDRNGVRVENKLWLASFAMA